MHRRAALVVWLCALAAPASPVSASPPVALGVIEVRDTPMRDTGIFVIRAHLDAPWPPLETLPAELRPLAVRAEQLDARRAAAVGAMSRAGTHSLGPTLQALIADDVSARDALRRGLARGGSAFGAEAWLLRGRLERDTIIAAHLDVEDAALREDRDPPPIELGPARTSFSRAAALGGTHETGLWARLLDADAALEMRRGISDATAAARYESEATVAYEIVAANATPSPLRSQALLELADLHEGDPSAAAYLVRARDGANEAELRYLDLLVLRDEQTVDPDRALVAALALVRGAPDDPAVVQALAALIVSLDDADGARLPSDVPAERAAAVLLAAANLAFANGDRVWAERAAASATMRAATGPTAPQVASALATIRAAPILVEGAHAWLGRIGRLCALHTELRGEPATTPIDVDVRLTRVRHHFRVVARPHDANRPGAPLLAHCVGAPGHDDPAIADGDVVTATLRFTEGAVR